MIKHDSLHSEWCYSGAASTFLQLLFLFSVRAACSLLARLASSLQAPHRSAENFPRSVSHRMRHELRSCTGTNSRTLLITPVSHWMRQCVVSAPQHPLTCTPARTTHATNKDLIPAEDVTCSVNQTPGITLHTEHYAPRTQCEEGLGDRLVCPRLH